MGYIYFLPKMYMRNFSQEETRYCKANKYSTEIVINASRN